jgi:hypothetical protein
MFDNFVPKILYKVVQIWPGLFVCKQVTVCPSHIWATLYLWDDVEKYGVARLATDDDVRQCMHFACWITKPIYTHTFV